VVVVIFQGPPVERSIGAPGDVPLVWKNDNDTDKPSIDVMATPELVEAADGGIGSTTTALVDALGSDANAIDTACEMPHVDVPSPTKPALHSH